MILFIRHDPVLPHISMVPSACFICFVCLPQKTSILQFNSINILSNMPTNDHKYERRASVVQQRRLSQQFKNCAWLAPPSDVRTTKTL